MPRRHQSLKNKLKLFAIEDLVKGHDINIESMDEDQRLEVSNRSKHLDTEINIVKISFSKNSI